MLQHLDQKARFSLPGLPQVTRRQAGFTLVELMVVMIVVTILAAIAIPAYTSYVVRGRLSEAFAGLGAVQPAAEQFWSNNRTFVGLSPLPGNTTNFTYSLSVVPTVSTYTVKATGIGPMAGFAFTIDQSGNRATTSVPVGSGYSTSATCWQNRRGGGCLQ